MDKMANLLSEGFPELCSSFESGSEDNTSFEKTPLSFHRTKNISNNENCHYKSPECSLFTNKLTLSNELDCSISDRFGDNSFSQSNGSDAVSILNTPENSSLSMVKMFDGLSLNNGQFPSTSKMKEYKLVLSEANDAYIQFLTSQFLLDSYKVVKRNISPELAGKVEEAVTGSVVGKLSVLKSKKGERYNLLGLEKDQICISTKGTLSSSEKMLVSKEVAAVVKSNVQLLSSQQKTLRGIYGTYCQKVVQPNSLLCEERERLAELHNCVQNQLDQACQLLVSTNQLMQQSVHLLQTSEQDLALATFTSLRDKTKYLQSTASILRLKMEEKLYKDKNQTKALNTLGSEMKTSVDAMAEELKSLQKTLGEYEKKAETSRHYKELVADYSITKRQLHHKRQTLSVLNDPDISFT